MQCGRVSLDAPSRTGHPSEVRRSRPYNCIKTGNLPFDASLTQTHAEGTSARFGSLAWCASLRGEPARSASANRRVSRRARIRCLVHFHGRERLAAGREPPGLCETRHTRPKMYPQFSILNSSKLVYATHSTHHPRLPSRQFG
jgi:hypothetical protein